MNIAIVGTGYVGLVTGACFSEMGVTVHCVDTDTQKIVALKEGKVPIYEPNLEPIIKKNSSAGRLHFHTDLVEVLPSVEIIFLAVGTPPDEDGSADLQHILAVAKTLGEHLESYKLIVTKSTVPVGTSEEIRSVLTTELHKRGLPPLFDLASNPEFLKEGDAVSDFMKPDRVVVGVDSEKAKELMTHLYRPMLLNNFRVIFMDIPSAEMTKYAANAMLATRISFMNDLARLCEKTGADIHKVRQGIGSDQRIGSKFLYAGCGYGGSCFPKDVKALIASGEERGVSLDILKAVEKINEEQKKLLFHKFSNAFNGHVKGKRVAVWGLAFKPNTDDMREAPAITLIQQLLEAKCQVAVYDPVAMDEAKRLFGDALTYSNDMYEATLDADALFHVTEWKEFRMPNKELLLRTMKTPLIIDGRNVFAPEEWQAFQLLQIGC